MSKIISSRDLPRPTRTYRIRDCTDAARLPEIEPGGVLCVENHSDRPVTLMMSRGVSPLRDVVARHVALSAERDELKADLDESRHLLDRIDITVSEALEAVGRCPGKPAGFPDRIDAAARLIRERGDAEARISALRSALTTLARLVDAGDRGGAWDEARKAAGRWLEGEGEG